MKQKQPRSLVQNKASIEGQHAQQRAAYMAEQHLITCLESMPGIPLAERTCFVDFIRAMHGLTRGTTMTYDEMLAWGVAPQAVQEDTIVGKLQ